MVLLREGLSLCRDWPSRPVSALEEKTRILMFNTPSAPLGKVFSREELEQIAAVVRRHPKLLVVSDEARAM